MASSMFEYAVCRPYPFQWFTPVVFIGGAIALVLFSLLNFLSTGYTQRYNQPYIVGLLLCIGSYVHSIEYVTDPNATISSDRWLNRWPSYFISQIDPSCQAENVQDEHRYFSQYGYRVARLMQPIIFYESNRAHIHPYCDLDNRERQQSSYLTSSNLI